MSETHLRLLAMTTSGQHLHASDMVSPNRGWEEEPSPFVVSLFQNLLKWWSPAFPARPWLFHLRPPEGRVHSALPPHQPTSPLGQQRALPGTRGPLAQTTASAHGARQAAVRRLLPPELSPPGTKLPPTLWNYEPSTAVRLQHACFSPSCLGRSHRPSRREQKNWLHLVRNQQGAFLDLA